MCCNNLTLVFTFNVLLHFRMIISVIAICYYEINHIDECEIFCMIILRLEKSQIYQNKYMNLVTEFFILFDGYQSISECLNKNNSDNLNLTKTVERKLFYV